MPINKYKVLQDIRRNSFVRENFNKYPEPRRESVIVQSDIPTDTEVISEPYKNSYGISSSPNIFGPAYWFTLHVGALNYPLRPSPIVIDKMKNFINAIPIMVPCVNCKEHATAYIEKNYDKLDSICSSRDSLFKFFVDFHNEVNIQTNKPVMSYEDAYKLYSGNIHLTISK